MECHTPHGMFQINCPQNFYKTYDETEFDPHLFVNTQNFQNTFSSSLPLIENFGSRHKHNDNKILFALIWDIFIFSIVLYLIYWKNASYWLLLIPILLFQFPF